MPLPSNSYIASPPLQDIFLDKDTAAVLSGGAVYFWEDENRTVPKPVYLQTQLPDNTYQFDLLPNPLTLSAIGTFQNNGTDIIPYYYPFDANGLVQLYYITVYSSDGIFQFSREAWPPNVEDNANITSFGGQENQISNPQFVQVTLGTATSVVFSVTGTNTVTNFAPDWALVTSGNGTVTVSQLALTDIVAPSSPPYAIQIQSSGISSLQLRQRLTNSPRILGQLYVSGSLVAKTFGGSAAVPITMDYTAFNGYTVRLITGTIPGDGNYTTIVDASAASLSTTNTTAPGTNGYVDILITIPVGSNLGITSVQVIAVANASSSSEFLQETTGRQIDHLFHYYKTGLDFKPIPSYLVGWDFNLNPAQTGDSGSLGAIGANKSAYVWDQTILFSSVNNVLSYNRNSLSGGFAVSTSAPTSFAIIQYVEGKRAIEILSQHSSVKIEGFVSSGTLNGTVSLFWTADVSAPNINPGTNNSLVSSISAGVPTAANGTWNLVSTSGLPQSFTLLTSLTSTDFTAFESLASASLNTVTFMAIVITFDTMSAAQTITLDYGSLVSGTIATRPAPQTNDEVLRESQYFLETTFAQGATVPSAVTGSILSAPMIGTYDGVNTNISFPQAWGGQWIVAKRAIPSVGIYSGTTTTPARAQSFMNTVGGGNLTVEVDIATKWAAAIYSKKTYLFIPIIAGGNLETDTTAGNSANCQAWIQYHYICDARIGIV